jgi:hypothetical protein
MNLVSLAATTMTFTGRNARRSGTMTFSTGRQQPTNHHDGDTAAEKDRG